MDKDILREIPILSPRLFTWENWGMPMMFGLDFAPTVEHIRLAVRTYAIGYCDSEYLAVRPRNSQYAVMFKNENGMFWFQIEKKYLENEVCAL